MAVLAEKLVAARQRAYLTQKMVAERMGVHQSTISRMESGERGVSAEELLRLAEIYNMPMDFFIDP